MTTAGRRTCRFAIESIFAAPVSCKAIRKSDALRMPRIRLFFIETRVGLARAGRDRDVVEAQLPRVLDRERPAEAHAAVEAEAFAPRERQVHQRQKILVPAHGDAVLRHAAEAREHARVQLRLYLSDVADGARDVTPAVAGQLRVERLDLQAVDADDAEALVE